MNNKNKTHVINVINVHETIHTHTHMNGVVQVIKGILLHTAIKVKLNLLYELKEEFYLFIYTSINKKTLLLLLFSLICIPSLLLSCKYFLVLWLMHFLFLVNDL